MNPIQNDLLNIFFTIFLLFFIYPSSICPGDYLPLQNLHMVVANYTEEGQTTLHHRESLKERYQVMARHYGHVSTFLMHCWFVVRALFK